MKNVLKTSLISLLAVACSAAGDDHPELSETNADMTKAVDVIVLRKPGTGTATLSAGVTGRVKRNYHGSIEGFAGKFTKESVERLKKDPTVLSVEPDGIATVSAAQTLSHVQWGLDRIDDRTNTPDLTYEYEGDGRDVDVYVVDTGIRYNHQEFGGRAKSYWDYVNNDADAQDDHGHGTHVAGTVGGSTVGVAKRANLWAVKVLSEGGWGSFSDIIAAVNDITEIKRANPSRKIVGNMSLGGGNVDALTAAIEASTAAGVVWVVAAGNSAENACHFSPASAPSAITVGATESSDYRAYFSNFGSCVDIFAPGDGIYSSTMNGNNTYESWSGTSMASPHVAGAVALYLSANPSATPASVTNWLMDNSTKNVVLDPGDLSPNRLLYSLKLVNNNTMRIVDLEAKRSTVKTRYTGRRWSGPEEYWVARFEAEVRNSKDERVTNVTVTASTCVGPITCVTGYNGRCAWTREMRNMYTGPCTFTVTGVTKAGSEYDQTGNSDRNGNSDGTTIVAK